MSKHELVDGYIRGDITRRTFVRRLTATGVSLAAALSYAELLRPATASAAPGEPLYYEGDIYYEREEQMPPDVVTRRPRDVTDRSAVAEALIDPNRQETDVWAEIRPAGTLAWAATGSVTASGDIDRVVSVPVSGLAASRDYEVRAVASNGSGTMTGEVVGFTTAPAPASSTQTQTTTQGETVVQSQPAAVTAAAQPPADRTGPNVRLETVTTKLSRFKRIGSLRLEMTADEDAIILVNARLSVPVTGVRSALLRSRRVTVATGTAVARRDRPTKVKLELRAAGRRALKRRTAARILLNITVTDRAGNERQTTAVIRLTD